MYKLIIVDDEEIEREGMARFISWDKYDIELCGTAQNGAEALEKIMEYEPDIVLTDVKMPVMNGIELIRRLYKTQKNIVVIVLSGYGEYEFTSQAMEYGVRHYILKPCDEDKIVSILDDVKKEVEQKKEYRTIKRGLLPHAKGELLRRLMLDSKVSQEELNLLKKDLPDRNGNIKLLAMKNKVAGFEYLEQFALGNILGEILGMDKMPLFTSVDDTVLFVIDNVPDCDLKESVQRTLMEFSRNKTRNIKAAVSRDADIMKLKQLYEQIAYLYALSENSDAPELLCYPESEEIEFGNYYFDFDKIRRAGRYDEVLFEVTLAIKKMQSYQFSLEKIKKVCKAMVVTWENFLGIDDGDLPDIMILESENEILECMGRWLAQTLGIINGDKESERINHILTVVYCNFENTGLNIQYMAKNILFMNEDYFGRVFVRTMNLKFSSYLEYSRIEMAKRLFSFWPEMKISVVTELVGYPADGQYFSKAFRKISGKTPTEYREMLKKSSTDN